MVDEIWSDIESYKGYYKVSNFGRIKNIIKGNILSNTDNGNGYLIVGLSKNGHRKNHYIHRLVAKYFVFNPCPSKFNCVNHIDFNKQNNEPTNLEWTDYYGNIHHTIKNGRAVYLEGEDKPTAKITANDVIEIRNRSSQGETKRRIAEDYPISEKEISAIVLKRKWKSVK